MIMSNKEIVIEAVRKLPEDSSLQEIADEVAVIAAIRRGEEDSDAGRTIPHDEVKRRFQEWISKSGDQPRRATSST
jgi:predicted transcriptional regulator